MQVLSIRLPILTALVSTISRGNLLPFNVPYVPDSYVKQLETSYNTVGSCPLAGLWLCNLYHRHMDFPLLLTLNSLNSTAIDMHGLSIDESHRGLFRANLLLNAACEEQASDGNMFPYTLQTWNVDAAEDQADSAMSSILHHLFNTSSHIGRQAFAIERFIAFHGNNNDTLRCGNPLNSISVAQLRHSQDPSLPFVQETDLTQRLHLAFPAQECIYSGVWLCNLYHQRFDFPFFLGISEKPSVGLHIFGYSVDRDNRLLFEADLSTLSGTCAETHLAESRNLEFRVSSWRILQGEEATPASRDVIENFLNVSSIESTPAIGLQHRTPARLITFEGDYRDSARCVTPPQYASAEMLRPEVSTATTTPSTQTLVTDEYATETPLSTHID